MSASVNRNMVTLLHCLLISRTKQTSVLNVSQSIRVCIIFCVFWLWQMKCE